VGNNLFSQKSPPTCLSAGSFCLFLGDITMPNKNTSQSAHHPRPKRKKQKGMQGIPFDFDEVKDQAISASVTPTSKEGFDKFVRKYDLGSRNQGFEILGRIAMKLPVEIVKPLIDAEFSNKAEN
jgi:hypothetical protein